ncbi:hypothetical protein EON76_06515 [bacterium]|nr:MAG: hypothetical protein EON76_06515 [bacterium]
MKTKISLASARTGFAMLFSPALGLIKSRSESHPRFFFFAMLLAMGISALMAFTMLRQPPAPGNTLSDHLPIGSGVQMPGNATALLEVMALQSELKTFLDKPTPDIADSLRMEEILHRIQQLNSKLKRP